MKVSIVTCYESNEERVSFVFDACRSRGYETNVITTDFSHMHKEKRNNIPENFEAIKAKPYKKNLSIDRLVSHRQFAKDAFSLLEKYNPDLIWLIAPANSLIKEANNYKKTHNVKIIIDIIDMWPESLPINYDKHLFPFNIWRNIRKNNINCADALVTECNLYQDILYEEYKKDIKTIYWARKPNNINKELNLPEGKLSLCYIGSINNIIDINRIYSLIKSCETDIVLHLIGEGEKTNEMVNRLNEVCEVIYHGPIRDEVDKNKIFNMCHAGINIYKEGLYIGLTVKCIDYLEHGLPLINNIKGDTWFFVVSDNLGINVNKNTKLKADELINLRLNNNHIYEFFNKNFTKNVFENKCLEVIDEVLK